MPSIELDKKYDRQRYIEFLRNKFLPNDFKVLEEEMPQFNIDRKYTKMKKVTLLGECASMGLKVFEFNHESPNDPRVTLTRETFNLMKDFDVQFVLAFYISKESDNFRFSFISVDKKIVGKKIKATFSNPRRYSYFLGPDAKVGTPYRFLVKKGRVQDIDLLFQRFSVEVVNKEFYEAIAILYTKLVGGERKVNKKNKTFPCTLKFPPGPTSDKKNRKQEFAVRLIGRIIFCWFLKKKNSANGIPLIPDDILSLETVQENTDYYHSVLERLFFEVLNTSHNDRKPEFQKGSFEFTPFLNGGLFEPHIDDYYQLNKSANKTSVQLFTLKVPDKWLRELFELLSSYNFTIDENTPMDVELSVDPEMLGRIFENLLAEINPETGESARKKTGSYYTPRNIVEYMVDQSLIHYLNYKTNIDTQRLQRLISFCDEEEKLSVQEGAMVAQALDTVKIIDPACGSGAFPMGILQKMVLLYQKADPELKIWKDKQLRGLTNRQLLNFIEERIQTEDWNYLRKLEIIKDAIYGIDIQQIAVEIAKLRVFLSLIVDTRIDEKKYNRGVEPLPNLEFKFVCANTLAKLPEKTSGLGLFESKDHIYKLKEIMNHYFNSFGSQKRQMETEFKSAQQKMFDSAIENNTMNEQTEILSAWDPFTDKAADWFDMEWMFGVKNGFDIVVANPPYVRQEAIRPIKPRLEKDFDNFFCGTADLYTYFYKKGIDLLKQSGFLCFIAPNKFMRTGYGKNTRLLLSRTTTLRLVIDFGELPVFDAGTDPAVILVENKPPADDKFTAAFIKTKEETMRLTEVINRNGHRLNVSTLGTQNWTLESSKVRAMLDKISKTGTPLGRYVNNRFYRGILTGLNQAFVIDETVMKKLIAEDPKSAELIKPWLRGQDIKRWKSEWAGVYIIAIASSANKHWAWSEEKDEKKATRIFKLTYPAIFKHLSNWEIELRKREDQGKFWWELRSCKYYEQFDEPKIIYADIAKFMRASYDASGIYCANTLYIIPTDDLSLLAIIYSRVFDWYSRHSFLCLGDPWKGGRLRFIAQYMEKVSIPEISKDLKHIFNCVVSYILVCTEINLKSHAAFFERLIDGMVFELYFPDEIKSAGKDILRHIGELQPIDDAMSDDEKLSIIQEQFNRLNDPSHPVRNNLDTLDSVEEVRIIFEALK